ncbi:MAG: ZIP family metal transporter [Parcubacteria group bacterium]
MTILFTIIIATFIISLISFIGVLTIFLKENILNKILLYLVAFSAGALIGGAFLHLIPESLFEAGLDKGKITGIFISLIVGFCVFFVMEQFIKWHHHHSTEHPEIKPFSYLILISDGLHNFIDGLVIAGSFMVGISTGIITSLAVILHEIPQEIGDFAVLIYGGFKKTKALFLNFISATLAVLGGIVGFFIFKEMRDISFLLPFTAGTFIYIAASDLIPQIKEEWGIKKSMIHFLLFLAGIVMMLLMKTFIAE